MNAEIDRRTRRGLRRESRRSVLAKGAALAAGWTLSRAAGLAAAETTPGPGAADGPLRGRALAFDPDGRLLVGDPSAGRVTILERDGAAWREVAAIFGPREAAGFGAALAAGEAGALIGARGPGRPETAAGAVFLAPAAGGPPEALDRSDADVTLGHAVAADGPRFAWTRRRRDPVAPRGEIALEGPEGAHRAAAPEAADFLGAGLALSGDVLVAAAAAVGPRGGAAIFRLGPDGPGAPRLLPAPDRPGLGRVGEHAAAAPGLVIVSGEGLVGTHALAAEPDGPPASLAGRGPAAASRRAVAFADAAARLPDFGPRRALAHPRRAGGDFGPPVALVAPGLEAAAWARVALTDDHLALAWAGRDGGPPGLAVFDLAALFEEAAEKPRNR